MQHNHRWRHRVSIPTCEVGYAKHTLLLDPSLKFHCHIYNYVFFSYEAMTEGHKSVQSLA